MLLGIGRFRAGIQEEGVGVLHRNFAMRVRRSRNYGGILVLEICVKIGLDRMGIVGMFSVGWVSVENECIFFKWI